MNDLECSAIGTGLLKFLSEKTEHPLDAVAILGMALLMVYDLAADKSAMTIDQFAQDFKSGLIETYKTKYDQGTGRVQ